MSETVPQRLPSRRNWRWWYWSVLWIFGIFLVGILIDQTDTFKDCMHTHKNRGDYRTLHESVEVFGGAIVRERTRLRLLYACAGDFTDKNNAAIVAVATSVVAFFTFTLWYTTRGLRRLGESQADQMRDLLQAARDNADAMGKLRDAMAEQAKATGENVRIARDALTLSQRPRIRVREIEPDFTVNMEWYFQEGQPVTGNFWIANVGGSQAAVKVWRCHVWWSQRGLPPAWPNTPPFKYDGSDIMPVLTAGAHCILTFQSPVVMGKEGHDISTARGEWELFLIGRITYADELGVTRTTGFCRRFQKNVGETGRFIRVGDPDLEYED